MYTRSFNDNDTLMIPDGYGGSALSRPEPQGEDQVAEGAESGYEEAEETSSSPKGLFNGGRFGSIFGGFSDILSRWGLRIPKIGIEELIIIAVAAFLLFSPEGDRECSIMLLLLLFVG